MSRDGSSEFRPAAQCIRPEKAWFRTGAVQLWGNSSDVHLSRPVSFSKCFFSPRRALHAWAVVGVMFVGEVARAASYYVHPVTGDDARAGTSADAPWKTLEKANAVGLKAGDRVLLAAGQTFQGQLTFAGLEGTAEAPIVLASYPADAAAGATRAKIDARGYVAAVHLKNSRHVRISDLVVTADGGGMRRGQPAKADMRCGVLIEAEAAGRYGDIELTRLQVSDVSFEEPGFVRPAADVKTANGTGRYGFGIRFIVKSPGAQMSRIAVTDCEIENVNHTGLKFTAPNHGIEDVRVERVRIVHAGGPGVQLSGVRGGRFRELVVDHSGSTRDTRNWGRGSGLWTWGSSDVVIERSQFLHANGPGDSAGVHIDYNCRNVVVQYNLSANNAGGFCEVLGNNYNCAYRYNVSVNDGRRVKGKGGAFQEGKTFWLSGYVGKGPRRGPFNTYVYHNTIYTDEDMVARMAVGDTAAGVLIANNIFHLRGRSQMVQGDQFSADRASTGPLKNVVFENNLFLRADNWPAAVGITDRAPLLGDPAFARPGGLALADFTPGNAALVKDRGVPIEKIPGDEIGLTIGLAVERDILGRPIVGPPDLGAIELP
jgi:hypothetical protein